MIGYQPDSVFGVSMTKLYYVTDAGFVRAAIAGVVLLMVMNILLVVFLFWNNTRKVEKAVEPIIHGIEDISHAKENFLPETGELADVNKELNYAGAYIMRKDKARAEWINGVSHDVRTPLSVILGYAGELSEDSRLSDEAKQTGGYYFQAGTKVKTADCRFESDFKTGICNATVKTGKTGYFRIDQTGSDRFFK